MMSLNLLCFLLYVPFITSRKENGGKESCRGMDFGADNTAVEESKLLGSNPANITGYPFLAVVVKQTQVFCSAARIRMDWLATTAKCILNLIKNGIKAVVRFGSSFSLHGGNTLNIVQLVPNPNFNETQSPYANDIGLIQVNGSMDINVHSKSIEIIGDKVSIQPGASLQIFGYGIRLKAQENIAQIATVQVVPISMCVRAARFAILPTHIDCAQAKTVAACNGDIGGPALFNKKLSGIMIRSEKCAGNGLLMLTRVSRFRGWIISTMDKS